MNRARATVIALLGVMLAAPLATRAQAQNATITGKVTTEFGQPLEGANVYIGEMSISVGTNAQGNYTVTVPAARVSGQQVVLRVRSFGFVPQARPIRLTAGSQTVDFSLKQDVNRLSEVVVTGVTAGTSQRNLPFTVAKVDEREMPVPSANPLTQLQGKVPGANIVSATGRPGAAPAVLLRGPKSINGSGRGQEPLYIVDGVVLNGTLADINPADIESVEVVKGAAASSMYGSRAGNGVIQITTKSGRNAGEGVRFNVRAEYGAGDIENEFALAQKHHMAMDETRTRFCRSGTNCASTFSFADEALRINEGGARFSLSPVLFEREHGISAAPGQPVLRGIFQVEEWPTKYNPIGQLVTPGQRTNTSVDASGRVGGTSFFTSLNNYWEQGAMRFLNGYKRNSMRLNLDQAVGEDWTFGARTYFARSGFDGANAEQGAGFFRITRNPVGVDLLRRDAFGRLFIRSNPMLQGAQNYNPMYEFENARQQNSADRFLGTLTSRYTPFSWLDFDGSFSYDRSNRSLYYIEDRGFRTTAASTRNLGYIERDGFWDQSLNAGLNASARKSFGDLNSRYTARYLYEQQDGLSQFAWGSDILVAGLQTLNAAITGRGISSGLSSIRSIGMMAGVDVDWKERYIAGVLARRDGSSLFGAANRWANYGRGSLAWRMSDEPWWFVPQVNEFKLRASAGTAGGRPPFVAQYETYTVSTGGLSPATGGNRDLRPETVRETEFGADIEVLSRFGLTANYAHSVASEQILPVNLPAISGFGSRWINAGTLENKTVELSLNVPIIQRRNLNWSTRLNYDATQTTITKLNVPPFLGGTNYQATEAVFRFAEGERYATFYGRKFATSCEELPVQFQPQCGGANAEYQKDSNGFIVWAGGRGLNEGITNNMWNAVSTASQSPWGQALHWGMPILIRDNATNLPAQRKLGSALPDYRLGLSSTFNYKKLFAYAQMDGSFGQVVWNQGRHWSFGDFMTADVDMDANDVGGAKPLGYFWRTTPLGTQGFYDVLGPTNVSVEDASYMKLREVNLSYNLGAIRGVGDWTFGVTGRNLLTFTDYKGFDPEVGNATSGSTSGSSAVNGIDSYGFPNLRTFTISIGTRF